MHYVTPHALSALLPDRPGAGGEHRASPTGTGARSRGSSVRARRATLRHSAA
eukprot:CAMPEP_0194313964 /NCGR_PEP_ID=MMETSP0171-20130528/10791_1 /TAXON_ID=218684 /ORGANISM="Corethron pennatum, Strain L29A3" /LENGTH=51 /DNA_ID=CAMNT_0039069147 /DNA_START=68 /DNA_END=219 /DNA_ORIENTATION=-